MSQNVDFFSPINNKPIIGRTKNQVGPQILNLMGKIGQMAPRTENKIAPYQKFLETRQAHHSAFLT